MVKDPLLESRQQQGLKWVFITIGLLLLGRLLSLASYPFFDTTESRYGEIARIMLETNNWVTPQIDYHVPFWGKPPLHSWITAVGYQLFGVNEFAARLPHWLMGLATLLLLFRFTRYLAGTGKAWLAVLILSSSLGFILASGMVMTDSSLLFSYALAMVSFYLCFNQVRPRLYGHLFFVALALGMLIKGPVLVVLVGIALVLWSVWQRSLWRALNALPWGTGLLVFFTICLPWYLWAESRTPGFLQYFIVGEHFNRFLVSGWQGDLYGSAHVRPRGSIWLFGLICAFPWSFVLVKFLMDFVKRKFVSSGSETKGPVSSLNAYLVCWMLAPLCLFTFAGNILPIYVLPGFAAMAVLLALRLTLSKRIILAASNTLVLLVGMTLGLHFDWVQPKSEASLLDSQQQWREDAELYYWQTRPFSAQFYSLGQAQQLNEVEDLQQLLAGELTFYLGMSVKEFRYLAPILNDACDVQKSRTSRVLMKCLSGRDNESIAGGR